MGGGAGEGKGEKGGVLTDLRSQRLWASRVPRSAHPGCCWLQPAGGEDEASLSCPLLAGLAWGGSGPSPLNCLQGPPQRPWASPRAPTRCPQGRHTQMNMPGVPWGDGWAGSGRR